MNEQSLDFRKLQLAVSFPAIHLAARCYPAYLLQTSFDMIEFATELTGPMLFSI
jgi:hypothetical protein